MNSVNWAGQAYSTPVEFKLHWLMPNGNPKNDYVTILESETGDKTASGVVRELVGKWGGKVKNKGGPYVISTGTAVHFATVVTKVELIDAEGNSKLVPDDGKILVVPGTGNEGLCCWLS